jgi:hypothetical protein
MVRRGTPVLPWATADLAGEQETTRLARNSRPRRPMNSNALEEKTPHQKLAGGAEQKGRCGNLEPLWASYALGECSDTYLYNAPVQRLDDFP